MAYDPTCYLCPGNQRAGGRQNPPYESTFVFENDFAAMRPGTPEASFEEAALLAAQNEPGECRVMCFSPRHDLTVAAMNPAELRAVVDRWVEQYVDLGAKDYINCVTIFENRGEMMGASNPHPHCQIWAGKSVAVELAKEQAGLLTYRGEHKSCLLCDYSALEERRGERVVCGNNSFIALVPFWGVWPFETMVIARRHITGLDGLTESEHDDLGAILKQVTSKYDRLFDAPFPYTMGFHQRPTDGAPHEEWHLHAHYFPPLLRSASVRKFMVGFELLAAPQRDITPESAAERLRTVT